MCSPFIFAQEPRGHRREYRKWASMVCFEVIRIMIKSIFILNLYTRAPTDLALSYVAVWRPSFLRYAAIRLFTRTSVVVIEAVSPWNAPLHSEHCCNKVQVKLKPAEYQCFVWLSHAPSSAVALASTSVLSLPFLQLQRRHAKCVCVCAMQRTHNTCHTKR